jgi:hypothetical protein
VPLRLEPDDVGGRLATVQDVAPVVVEVPLRVVYEPDAVAEPDVAAEAAVRCRLSFSMTLSRRSSYSSRSLRHSVTGGRGITMPPVTVSSGPNCSRVRSISMPMPRRFHQ